MYLFKSFSSSASSLITLKNRNSSTPTGAQYPQQGTKGCAMIQGALVVVLIHIIVQQLLELMIFPTSASSWSKICISGESREESNWESREESSWVSHQMIVIDSLDEWLDLAPLCLTGR